MTGEEARIMREASRGERFDDDEEDVIARELIDRGIVEISEDNKLVLTEMGEAIREIALAFRQREIKIRDVTQEKGGRRRGPAVLFRIDNAGVNSSMPAIDLEPLKIEDITPLDKFLGSSMQKRLSALRLRLSEAEKSEFTITELGTMSELFGSILREMIKGQHTTIGNIKTKKCENTEGVFMSFIDSYADIALPVPERYLGRDELKGVKYRCREIPLNVNVQFVIPGSLDIYDVLHGGGAEIYVPYSTQRWQCGLTLKKNFGAKIVDVESEDVLDGILSGCGGVFGTTIPVCVEDMRVYEFPCYERNFVLIREDGFDNIEGIIERVCNTLWNITANQGEDIYGLMASFARNAHVIDEIRMFKKE